MAAQRRMSAAKAAMKPIWEARETAKQQARIKMLVKAAEALVAGASRKEVAVLGGRRPGYWSMSDLLDEFWRSVLSHEEIYEDRGTYYDYGGTAWERRVSERALARYRERLAA